MLVPERSFVQECEEAAVGDRRNRRRVISMKKVLVAIVALLFALGVVGMSFAATAKKVGDDQIPADMKTTKDQKAKPGQLKDKPGLHKEKAPGQLKDKPGLHKEKAPGQLKDKPGQTKLKDSKAGQHKDQAPATVR